MSYKLTEETKQWIVSNYTAVGIIEAMEREGGEKALDIAKRLATKASVLAELITNPGRIKFVGDADTKPAVETVVEVVEVVEPAVKVIETVIEVVEPVVEVVEPIVTVTEPIVTITEPIVTVTEPIVTVTEPIVTITEPVVEVAPKAKTPKKK